MSDKQAIIEQMQAALPDVHVKTDAQSLQTYALDWTAGYSADALAVLLPDSTQQVQQIVQFARAQQLAIVPSGGRTGLSAGAVAMHGELVVSLERMRQVLDFNVTDRLLTCQAGVITQHIQDYVLERGFYFPVDFASKGSSQIGGNVATNAGGIKVLRYGLMRDWVAGLTVVTGAGEVLHLNQGLVKNASGYDLRHLFIGSEGTLGIITEVMLQVTSIPPAQSVMVLALRDLAHITDLLQVFRQHVSLSAFEFFSDIALQYVLARNQQASPLQTGAPYYVLLEYDQNNQQDEDKALAAFEYVLNQGWINDGVISQSETQARQLWCLREDIGETLGPYAPYKNDIAVRPSKVPMFLHDLEAVMQQHYPDYTIVWFGHIGDGNLHVNILKPEQLSQAEFTEHCQHVTQLVFALVQRHGGTISAEHGVGLLKQPYLNYVRSAEEIMYMQKLKHVFDPDLILNPGKLLGKDN